MAGDHPNEQKALQHRFTCRCAVVLTVSAYSFTPAIEGNFTQKVVFYFGGLLCNHVKQTSSVQKGLILCCNFC
jgi:hypothetical protein